MRELETCEMCENGKANWKYIFSGKNQTYELKICDRCASFMLDKSNDKLNRYRNLERITPPKVYIKTK